MSDSAGDKWDEKDILATVLAFEITIELAWKLLKNYMEEQGWKFNPAPKAIIREAFKQQIITDAQVWMDALEARNRTAHTYDSEVAEQLMDDIMYKFLPVFADLRQQFNLFEQAE